MKKPACTITIDPTDIYPQASDSQLIQSCGLILPWAVIVLSDRATVTMERLRDNMEKLYNIPMYPMEGGTLDEKGVYRYPEDPPLPPVATVENSQTRCFIYPYAITAFCGPDGTFITRMD